MLGWTSKRIKVCADHGSDRNALTALLAITAVEASFVRLKIQNFLLFSVRISMSGLENEHLALTKILKIDNSKKV